MPERCPAALRASSFSPPVRPPRDSPGRPLDDETRHVLEHVTGRDLTPLRIHDDPAADRFVRAAGARAVTAGDNVYLRAGGYRPDTPAGLALLAHEATHVAYRDSDGPPGTTGVVLGAVDDPCERRARAVERRVLARHDRIRAAGLRERHDRRPALTGTAAGPGRALVLRRGVGLEIEVPIPIDKLTAPQLGQIAGFIGAGQPGPALGATQVNGRVPYGVIRAAAPGTAIPGNGYRIDADHDDRVKSPLGAASPPREGGFDSIMEIVTQPPSATTAALNAVMADVQTFVTNIYDLTNNLTDRWPNAFAAVTIGGATFNVSVGPMDLTAQGFPLAAAMPQHNLRGSVQVNVDIDLREFHSLLHWYADSAHATAAQAPAPEQQMYRDIKQHIRDAVDAGRTVTDAIMATQNPLQRAQGGNFRGLRGWLTYLALYLRRGTIPAGVLGGTAKNLVPILVKSPNTVLVTYGMTAHELAYYNANRVAVLNQLLPLLGRPVVAGAAALPGVPVFASQPAGLNLDQFSDPATAVVPLAGTPVMNPPVLGPWRTGNAHVQAIASPAGAANTRGGLVAEFRNFPAYYDGVASWRAVGQDFLTESNNRNARDGIAP